MKGWQIKNHYEEMLDLVRECLICNPECAILHNRLCLCPTCANASWHVNGHNIGDPMLLDNDAEFLPKN
jgi:hypothetical protein